MGAWTIFKHFDARSKSVYLDIVDASAPAPARASCPPHALETFAEYPEAQRFVDIYAAALERGGEQTVREVFCGARRRPGCEAVPCYLGVSAGYRCALRDRVEPR